MRIEACINARGAGDRGLLQAIHVQEARTSPGSPMAAPNSPEEKLEKLVQSLGMGAKT